MLLSKDELLSLIIKQNWQTYQLCGDEELKRVYYVLTVIVWIQVFKE